VGRDRELAELDAALARGARLLSVLGAAGAGKSRLVRRWAQARSKTAGVKLAELGDARSLEEMLAAVAAAIGGDRKPPQPERKDGREHP
jgi:hypothetical protein